MGPSLEFLILGPVEVRVDGRALPLKSAKQRSILCVLLVNTNRVVSSDELIDRVWGNDPPATAPNLLQVHISNLRKVLEPQRSKGDKSGVLVTRPPGYMLRLLPEQLDSAKFERLVKEGQAANSSRRYEEAAARLSEALSFWRGNALADLAYEDFAQAEAARLAEIRLVAIEERFDAELALGRSGALVADIEAAIAEHPLRERLRGQLMLALYRAGRQADALEAYQRARQMLVDELGVVPSPAMQELERSILNQDPSLDVEPAEGLPVATSDEELAHLGASTFDLESLIDSDSPHTRDSAIDVGVTKRTVSVNCIEFLIDAPSRPDPEVFERVLSSALRTTSQIVEKHGGMVQSVVGTEAVAMFGVSRLHEDDALRAVRAAVELRTDLDLLGAETSARLGLRLSSRAGVNTGQILVGGTDSRAGMGDAVASAARLMRAAKPGEILIEDSTRELVSGAVIVRHIEPPPSPAGPRIAPAWRVEDMNPRASGLERRLDSELVGRSSELSALHRAFDQVVAERRAFRFLVVGAAGIGKSRLAIEFGSTLRHGRILGGQCLPYGEGNTFWPLVDVLEQATGDLTLDGIRGCLKGDSEQDLVADVVAAVVGITDKTFEMETVFWGLRRFLEACAREAPLVVCFDDLHWAEPSFLDLVEHLSDWISDEPVLLLCLARPDLLLERPEWAGGKRHVSSIVLDALDLEESDQLIDNLLGGPDINPDQRERITEAAEGNPLFLEQFVAMYALDSSVDATWLIPSTIQSLLAARLDRLEPSRRALIERAAIMGTEFWPSALLETSEADWNTLSKDVQDLVNKEFVEPCRSTLSGRDALRFRHTLIRDSVYEETTKALRADFHERVGDWLESVVDQQDRDHVELVAYHLEQANQYRKELRVDDEQTASLAVRAGRKLGLAGSRASARGDVTAAASLLSRAIETLPNRDPERLGIRLRLAEVRMEQGEFSAAARIIREVMQEVAEVKNHLLQARARLLQVELELKIDSSANVDELVTDAQSVLDIFESHSDETGLAKAWTVLAWIPWVRCQAGAAEAAFKRAAEYAIRVGDERIEATCTAHLLGAGLYGPLPVSKAIARCEAALDHPYGSVRAAAKRALAVLRAMQGNFLEAEHLIAEDKAILADLGLTHLAASVGVVYSDVQMLAGNLEQAERELRASYEILDSMGDRGTKAAHAAYLAEVLVAQGELDEARRLSELAARTAPTIDLQTLAPARGARAKLEAIKGHFPLGEQLAREALTLADETDWLNLRGDARMNLAYVLELASRSDEALAVGQEAIELYERKGNSVSTSSARIALSHLTAV